MSEENRSVEPNQESDAEDLQDDVNTDRLEIELGKSSIHGGIALLITRFAGVVITILSTMILARLLTPEDYGLFAMVATLIAFVFIFRGFGLKPAIIHQEKIDDLQLSQIYWVSIGLGALLALGMAVLAPLLARFYGEPSLTGIVLVLAIGIFIDGFRHVYEAILLRKRHFVVIGLNGVGSLLVGAIVGIGLAYMKTGYWALVGQQMAIFLVRTMLALLTCRWQPIGIRSAFSNSLTNIGSIITFSRHTIFAHMVGYVRNELDRILIGRFTGASTLGYYQSARRLSVMPIEQIIFPIRSVAITSMSRLYTRPAAYRRYSRRAFLTVNSITLPAFIFIVISAPALILVLLGSQWLAVIPLLRILGIAAVFDSFSRLTVWIYLSEGQTKRRLRYSMISTPILIIGVTVGLFWGTIGVAIGYSVAMILQTIPSVQYCIKSSHLRSKDFWLPVWRPALAASIAMIVLFLLDPMLSEYESALATLVVSAIIFMAVYLASWIILPGGSREASRVARLLRLSISGR